MVPFDESLTRNMLRVIDRLQDCDSVDLPLTDHPVLRLQRGDVVQTEWGDGYLFSMGQLSQVEPPVYEAKLMLIVIDQRNGQTQDGKVSLFPVAVEDVSIGEEAVGAVIEDGQITQSHAYMQKSLAAYTQSWLVDLQTAGYF